MKYLTIIALIVTVNCNGQYNIGSISLDSTTFVKYLSDCYMHPDTVMLEGEYMLTDEWGEEQNRLRRIRNQDIIKSSIGRLNPKYERSLWPEYFVPRKPSEIDFIKWKMKHK